MLKKHWWKFILAVLALGVIVTVWFFRPRAGTAEAKAALESTELVTVTSDPWLTFTPAETDPTTAFIFYPGASVLPEAYAPMMRDIASAGYLVVVPEMTLNFAILSSNKADDIIAAYPEIENWAIGGHSLGGVAAVQFIDSHPNRIDGLILWASFPNNDISEQNIVANVIYGTLDNLSTPDEIRGSAHRLPETTIWTEIEGGNHAQFGWYGEQFRDRAATISPQEQQSQIVEASTALLGMIDND